MKHTTQHGPFWVPILERMLIDAMNSNLSVFSDDIILTDERKDGIRRLVDSYPTAYFVHFPESGNGFALIALE